MRFEIGEKVVYPSQGVSVIESISEQVFMGETIECYNLRLLSTSSKVMVPVSNSERIGLRPLSEREQVAKVMGRLRNLEADEESDWKDRYRANLDRIKTGELHDVVDVILCLAEVAARKTLSFRERKMFDHAQQLLVYEVAEVEERSVDDVEREVGELIERRLDEAPA